MKEQDIYKMKLHEEVYVHELLFIIRVAGGWIYKSGDDVTPTSVFVPFNNEFQESK